MRKNNGYKDVIEIIRNNPYLIAKSVGMKDVRKFPHNEWMHEIISGTSDYTLMAHRGSYKSSCLSVCIALIMICCPEDNIIFLRKTDNDIAEMVGMVKKALNSEILKQICWVLHEQELTIIKASQSEITTNIYQSISGASQLLGIGLKSSITGKHANWVITDDICNVSDRISTAERERTKLQYQELQNIKNRNGRIINLGTKWHKDDVFSLMPNIHCYDYKSTNLITEEKIEALRMAMSPSLFACNYELKIIADENIIFPEPKQGADAVIIQNGIAHVDSAFYGEDYTAFTVMRYVDGHYYVYGRIWRKHVEDCYSDIFNLYNQFLCSKLYIERNADKGMVSKDLKRLLGLKTVDYDERMNKHIKIVTYLKAIWSDVIFVEGTDPEYIEQICDYTEDAEHDDAPDSAACLARLLYKKAGKEEYVSLMGLGV